MVGTLAILSGLALGIMLLGKGKLALDYLLPERRRLALLLAVVLLGLGMGELFFASGRLLFALRLLIGLATLAMAGVFSVGLLQTTALLMGLLMLLRAILIYLGFKP